LFGHPSGATATDAHSTTYRGLVRELDARGHDVLVLERSAPPAAARTQRDGTKPKRRRFASRYRGLADLKRRYQRQVREAHVVIVGAHVPEGAELGRWVTRTAKGVKAFYDNDTSETLSLLQHGSADYLTPALVPKFDLFLSFTGGDKLEELAKRYHAPATRALYCSFDPAMFYPEATPVKWDLGYVAGDESLATPMLEQLLVEPARLLPKSRMVTAGLRFPEAAKLPDNIQRSGQCSADKLRRFYSAQRFTLHLARADAREAGYSPSIRLFEAAACGTPIISDAWPGLDTLLKPRREVLIARSPTDVVGYLTDLSESERREIGRRARERVLADHTAAHRAAQLEQYVAEVVTGQLMA